jgi:hypothetical protein
MTPQQDARIAEAIRHVEMGFAAFSVWSTTADGVCKCGKAHPDQKSIGKHPIPPNGFSAASTDPDRVRTMLSAASEPNYGIVWPLDSPKGVVFEWDVDGSDWKARIDALKAEYGPLPPTKTTRSPSGGLHVFYRWPDGIPVPDGNHLHGFVVRWPWKGYVVGPGSRINGKTYTDVGTSEIATLPLSWAVTGPVRGSNEPLITVSGGSEPYLLPAEVETGHRHDEIAKFVASLWNRNISEPAVLGLVDLQLRPLFKEPMDAARLAEEVHHAFETAAKRWQTPAAAQSPLLQDQQGNPIDPLAVEMRIERPEPLDPHAMPLPTGLALLLDHFKPLTDAPWSSLLLASTVTMSALAGPAPTLKWRGRHRAALFGALVGHSGYGRKGATMRVVDQAFGQVDPMLDEITMSGVASGEVLVDILNASKANSLGTALIAEHEIAGLLTIASREGSILSTILRKAWDGDKVESRSRAKGTSSAFGYNVAFLGGVTPVELAARLDSNQIANGWANRFLWFHSEKREGGFNSAADDTLSTVAIDYLRDCITFARALSGPSVLIAPRFSMHLAPGAHARLDALAESLDVIPVGAIGSLRQRMPAHIVRLAMVAALLDQSAEVGLDHVAFGEAMAAYAVASMRAVFGTRVDDEVAQMILGLLQTHGWLNTSTLSQITRKEPARVRHALVLLLDSGLIEREDRKTGGRTANGYILRSS